MLLKAKIDNGVINWDNSIMLKNEIKRFENKEVVITIKEWKNIRTVAQNRFLWLYYGLIAKETGDLAVELHEFLKRKLLQPKKIKALGKEIVVPGSTKKLNTKEFNKYIEDIQQLTGIIAPNTNNINQLEEYLK